MMAAHPLLRDRRRRQAVFAAGCCALLAGCALGKEEAGALLPPPVAVAEAKKETAAAGQAQTASAAPELCDPGGGAVAVQDMLRKARESGTAANATANPAPAKPCVPKRLGASAIETGSIKPELSAPQPAGSASATPTAKADGAELFIDFEPGAVTLPDQSRRKIVDAVAARMLDGATRLRIVAARGGSGNMFDQAVIAQKRARVVNELLPARMVDSVEFDPMLPEDTVRIEFKSQSAAANRAP